MTLALPGVRGLHHVALAVPDLDEAIALWTSAFGAELELRAQVASQGVDAATLLWSDAGGAPGVPHGTVLELVAPLTDDSGIARFIAKRGAGLHHIGYAVDDVTAEAARLASNGLRQVDIGPRAGAAFFYPREAAGVLTELVPVRNREARIHTGTPNA